MRKTVFLFVGKKKDLQAKLAAMTGQNVIYLQHCELCGGLSKGDICLKCEPLFRRWTKKIALEMKATTKPFKPIIA